MQEKERAAEMMQPEKFTAIADIIVNQYVSEITSLKTQEGKMPSFDELYGRLKTLNEELSMRAARIISRVKREQPVKEEEMVANYHQIIVNSVVGFVARIG